MKVPKERKRYCPKCKKHTVQVVSQAKRRGPGSAHPMSYGSKTRARLRGQARGHGNLGRYSKPAVSKFKMTGKKLTKKTDFRYQCKECKKMTSQWEGIRAKKVEII